VSVESFVLVLANFAMIGALPRVFFRQGRLHARWWLTAAPLFACASLQVASFAGILDAYDPGRLRSAAAGAAAVLDAGSIALLWYAVGTNRIPLALWHQDGDEPREIVSWGAYRRVRHPFYASFLLATAAGFALTPHPATLVTFVYTALALDLTARREERRLAASARGAEYRDYMSRTGRFLPRLGRAAT
jgi:protein-S-isoprenylcysteine O-methyltransferase Ste14